MSVTHLAGPLIQFGDRFIQRCAMCGDKLLDSKSDSIPCPVHGEVKFQGLPAAYMVKKIGSKNNWINKGPYGKATPPSDFCISLVEEV